MEVNVFAQPVPHTTLQMVDASHLAHATNLSTTETCARAAQMVNWVTLVDTDVSLIQTLAVVNKS